MSEQPVDALSERDAALLDFEASWWSAAGAKDDEIRARFGWTPAQYRRALGELLDRPAAEAHAPLLVRRLRRQRDLRVGQRSARP